MKLLKALLRAGADINRDSDTFGTPLKAAAIQGNLDTAKLLIEHGADANHASGYDAVYNKYKGTALQACAKRNHIAVVRILLEPYSKLTHSGVDYEDALIFAAHARHVEPVRLLLEKGTFSDPMAIRP